MRGYNERAHIGQHGWKAAETDRGNNGEMKRQRQKTGGGFHDRRGIESARLSGNSASKTIGSGSPMKAIRTRASTARPMTNGRRQWGRRSRNPVAIRRPAA